MKRWVALAKVAQVGAGAGIFFTPIFWHRDQCREWEEQVMELFLLVCLALALVCPVVLWWGGERKRAWQGLLVTVLLLVLAAGLAAPMVIR